jgi:hypothetical protein
MKCVAARLIMTCTSAPARAAGAAAPPALADGPGDAGEDRRPQGRSVVRSLQLRDVVQCSASRPRPPHEQGPGGPVGAAGPAGVNDARRQVAAACAVTTAIGRASGRGGQAGDRAPGPGQPRAEPRSVALRLPAPAALGTDMPTRRGSRARRCACGPRVHGRPVVTTMPSDRRCRVAADGVVGQVQVHARSLAVTRACALRRDREMRRRGRSRRHRRHRRSWPCPDR